MDRCIEQLLAEYVGRRSVGFSVSFEDLFTRFPYVIFRRLKTLHGQVEPEAHDEKYLECALRATIIYR